MSLAMLRPASPQATGVSYFLLPQLESREAPHLTMLRPLSFMRTPLHSTDLLLHRHSHSLTHSLTHTHTYTLSLQSVFAFLLNVGTGTTYKSLVCEATV